MDDNKIKELARGFVRAYAKDHQFFTGGDVLMAYRGAGHPDPSGGWRNVWGGLISSCAKQGWFVKSGRVPPTSTQSHTGTLVQWESRIFTGVPALVGGSVFDALEALRRDVVLRKIDLRTALNRAFDMGVECREM